MGLFFQLIPGPVSVWEVDALVERGGIALRSQAQVPIVGTPFGEFISSMEPDKMAVCVCHAFPTTCGLHVIGVGVS